MRGVVSMKQVADVAQLACVPRPTARRKQTISSLSQSQFEPRQSRVNDGDMIPTEIHERNELRRTPYRECNSRILLLVPLEPLSRVRGGARRATRSTQVQHRSAGAGGTQADADLTRACTSVSCEKVGVTSHSSPREQ